MRNDLSSLKPSQHPHELPRIIFFDIDGTLVDSELTIREKTVAAIKAIQARGIAVALASGRPFFAAGDIIAQLNIKDLCLFYSGGLIIDPLSKKIIHEICLSKQQVLNITSAAKQSNLYCELFTKDAYYAECLTPFSEIHAEYMKIFPKLKAFDELLEEEPIIKAEFSLFRGPQEQALKQIIAEHPELCFATASGAKHPNLIFVNILNGQASRKIGFEILLQEIGAQHSQTIAFGDGESDLPFLRCAGIGIAMGNAPRIVKEAADYVTKSVEEDGVVYALEKLGLI
ncbi:Cof-type HAD-IIB family hydrolase [Oligoflexia bacterium]|nr:Cof-type HAD-IIB family hydrolase [Oligoflexia bacterium]